MMTKGPLWLGLRCGCAPTSQSTVCRGANGLHDVKKVGEYRFDTKDTVTTIEMMDWKADACHASYVDFGSAMYLEVSHGKYRNYIRHPCGGQVPWLTPEPSDRRWGTVGTPSRYGLPWLSTYLRAHEEEYWASPGPEST